MATNPASGPNPTMPARRRHRGGRWVYPAVAVLVIGVVVIGGLATVPISHDFSGVIDEYGCGGPGPCSTPSQSPSLHSFPSGSHVSLRWQSVGTVVVDFYVLDPHGNMVGGCSQNGSTGACSFDPWLGEYEFNFLTPADNWTMVAVDYSGSFAAPMLYSD